VVLDDIPFRRPVVFYFRKHPANDRIAAIIDAIALIAPGGEQTATTQYSCSFGKEFRDIEPVQCLGNGNQVDGIGVET
jgi:hypothetical protein